MDKCLSTLPLSRGSYPAISIAVAAELSGT